MKSKKEIINKINELYMEAQQNPTNMAKNIIYTDALAYVLGEDYLKVEIKDYKTLYECKCDEVDVLYRIIKHIHHELSLTKLKDCPEEEKINIPLEIIGWIEQLFFIKKETEIEKK